MKKTLLLCFIHGFKGDDDTFGDFPAHLSDLVQDALPSLQVREIVYPKFETRGTLEDCVGRFRDWLQEKVIDLEVAAATPSPTVEPSVHTILVGHSMGGIVAADTLLLVANDQEVSSSSDGRAKSQHETNTLLFPSILGVLAFDTPYLGISPGVVAHGAEGHYNTISAAISQFNGITSAIWGGNAAAVAENSGAQRKQKKEPIAALPAPPENSTPSAWKNWSNIAMFAGAAGAIAASGTAAYMKRESITQGWTWAGSHLEFVGCLMKGEELKKRVAALIQLNQEMEIGWTNMYTRLGERATNQDGSLAGAVVGNQRTFCNLPKTEVTRSYFKEAINDAARDELVAHVSMFTPKNNPKYDVLANEARGMIVSWAVRQSAKDDTVVDAMMDREL